MDDNLTPEQIHDARKTLLPLKEAAKYADESLPPCEGLDHLSNATFNLAPPEKLCPAAYAGYQQIQRFDRHLRDNCRELARWAEMNLREDRLLWDPTRLQNAKKEIIRLHRSSQGANLNDDGTPETTIDYGPELAEPFGTKESDDVRCITSTMAVMQYRKLALSMAHKHFRAADEALDELAAHGSAEMYFHFLRYGARP